MMLSTANLLSPSDGGPVVAPTQDMVLGCYYLTIEREDTQGKEPIARFADETEALLAFDVSKIDTRSDVEVKNHAVPDIKLHSPIEVMVHRWDEEKGEVVFEPVRTTIGRVVFNQALPDRLLVYSDDGDEVAAKVHERGLGPTAVLVRRSTLEDVFLHLTGRTLVD